MSVNTIVPAGDGKVAEVRCWPVEGRVVEELNIS